MVARRFSDVFNSFQLPIDALNSAETTPRGFIVPATRGSPATSHCLRSGGGCRMGSSERICPAAVYTCECANCSIMACGSAKARDSSGLDGRKQCGENRHSDMNPELCSAQSETGAHRRDETNELQEHRQLPEMSRGIAGARGVLFGPSAHQQRLARRHLPLLDTILSPSVRSTQVRRVDAQRKNAIRQRFVVGEG